MEVTDAAGEGGMLTRTLLGATTPDVYLRNAFRLTQLSTSARGADVQRRQRSAAVALSINAPVPPGPAPLLPIEVGVDAFNKAVQRLQDPMRRFCEAIFWFWPGDASDQDRALEALANGDSAHARTVLLDEQQRAPGDPIVSHNLAVLHHLLALEWEDREFAAPEPHRGRVGEERVGEELWRAAFSYWRRGLDSAAFRHRLAFLVREIGDPRLSEGDVDEVYRALPVALLQINAMLAVRYAQDAHGEPAERQRAMRRQGAYMGLSGFPTAVQDRAARGAIQPARQALDALCQNYRHRAKEDRAAGYQFMRDLLEHTEPYLSLFDVLFAPDHVVRVTAHDQVVVAACDCLIKYGAGTSKWRAVTEAMGPLLADATSPDIRSQVQEWLDEALKLVAGKEFESDLERIAFARDRALQLVARSPGLGDAAARSYVREVRPLTTRVERALKASADLRESVLDQVAAVGVACLVTYGNTTGRWDVVASRLTNDTTYRRLAEMKQGLASLRDAAWACAERSRCAFCGRRGGAPRSEVRMRFHRYLQAAAGGVVLQFGTLAIPRCRRCQRRHAHPYRGLAVWALIVAGLCMVASLYASHAPPTFAGLLGLGGGALALCALLGLGRVSGRRRPLNETYLSRLQEVQALRAQGWQPSGRPAAGPKG